MIKYIKYMFVVAIAMIAVTGCQEDIEDSFSKKPTAPVLNNNGTILLTQNTISEDIVWTWEAARFLTGEVSYSLYAQYAEETAIQVGTATKVLNLSMSKTNFRSLLMGFQGIPENSSFSIDFYVVATDEVEKYESEKQTMTVYSYGNAISAEVTAEEKTVVLDVATPTEKLQLLSWTEARLGYAETITYGVYISYDEGELVEVAKDIIGLSCTKTVDEWNELAVLAGAPEAEASDLKFTVKAFSDSYPDGVPSKEVIINITTYLATYPDCLYVPGSHQGWNPEKAPTVAQSTLTKGLFERYIDLSTEDGSDVEFKFAPEPAWGNDFGADGEAEVSTDGDGNVVVKGKLGGENKNIKVPSGLYRLSVNKKLNTFEMLKIESMGVIGNATVGEWSTETPMEYDAESNTYSVVTNLIAGEYKFRANNNWTYSIGDNGSFTDGGNYTFDKADGEYKIVLDVNKHSYTVKLLSTEFPEKLYLPGSHQGWSPASAPTLEGNGEGLFEGAVNLVDASGTECQWKFSPKPAWEGDFGGTITLDESGYGQGTYGVSDNIVVPNGYYYVKVDMTAGTFELQRIDKVGLIGGFNGWGGDEEFAYDADKNVWILSCELVGGDEFKIRFNGGWDINRGIGGDAAGTVSTGVATPVYHNGQNMKVAADGLYTITLDMSTNPNTILMNK